MNGFNNKLISIIKDCDCFGKPLTFRINHEREYKSLLGGLSSIIFVMISIIYVTYMTISDVKVPIQEYDNILFGAKSQQERLKILNRTFEAE